jgi:hypothetical protein
VGWSRAPGERHSNLLVPLRASSQTSTTTADSREVVDGFHAAALAAGGTDNGPRERQKIYGVTHILAARV